MMDEILKNENHEINEALLMKCLDVFQHTEAGAITPAAGDLRAIFSWSLPQVQENKPVEFSARFRETILPFTQL